MADSLCHTAGNNTTSFLQLYPIKYFLKENNIQNKKAAQTVKFRGGSRKSVIISSLITTIYHHCDIFFNVFFLSIYVICLYIFQIHFTMRRGSLGNKRCNMKKKRKGKISEYMLHQGITTDGKDTLKKNNHHYLLGKYKIKP